MPQEHTACVVNSADVLKRIFDRHFQMLGRQFVGEIHSLVQIFAHNDRAEIVKRFCDNLFARQGLHLAHIQDKKCPAGVCKALMTYSIDADKCRGCTACARKCPAGAIEGNVKEVHTIHTDKCIKCGVCMETCKFGAIVKK